jgi:hypothetical protein
VVYDGKAAKLLKYINGECENITRNNDFEQVAL